LPRHDREPAPPPASLEVVSGPDPHGPSLPLRAVWFVLVGWWLAAIVIHVGYLLCVSIIGLPLGLAVLNRVPWVLTLRPRTTVELVPDAGGGVPVDVGHVRRRPLWVRALWFLLVGWWAGLLWVWTGYILCVALITLPLGLWMLNRIGGVLTLMRY
jgi:uncharacterized membrane protein YccF (DUF307 family)